MLHPKPLTFISDQQKGLILAVKEVFEDEFNVNYSHRNCFRHLYKNFKKTHPGLNLEKLTWKAARSYSIPEYKKWMDELEEASKKARHDMDHDEKFAEKFHIMMTRLFYERRVQGETYDIGGLVPRAKNILINHRNHNHFYEKDPLTDTLWTVRNNKEEMHWNVAFVEHTCTCCVWQISGLPCVHAISVIVPFKERIWNRHCDPSHLVESYEKTYVGYIKPILHQSAWGEPWQFVDTVEFSRPAGRPKTQRKKGWDEVTNPNGNQKQWSKCKQFGHNMQTCKGAPKSVATPGAAYYSGPHVRGKRATPDTGGSSSRGGASGSKGGASSSIGGGRGNMGGVSGSRGGGRGNSGGASGSAHLERSNDDHTRVERVGRGGGRLESWFNCSQESMTTQVSSLAHSSSQRDTLPPVPAHLNFPRNPTLSIQRIPADNQSRGGGVRMRGVGVRMRGGGAFNSRPLSASEQPNPKRSKVDAVPSPVRRSGQIRGNLGAKLNGMTITIDD